MLLFGTGSPILVDVEESLRRLGVRIAAGIQNRPGASHLSEEQLLLTPEQLTAALLELPFMVPLFTPGHRQTATSEATRLGLHRPFILIDPSVAVPHRLEVGPGSYVNSGCSLGGRSEFGMFVFINRGAGVGHHARLGAFVSIGPGAVIAGNVAIDAGGVVGAGATILPDLSVGANAVVAAGAVVTRDVPSGCLAAGNPARIVRRNIVGYKGVGVA